MNKRSDRNGLDKGKLQDLYSSMTMIRQIENTLSRLFADSEVPGFIHLSIGQEAVAVGVASTLDKLDTLATTHRGHGHVLARGMDVTAFFKEIMGRQGGLCKGRGGSMHVADLSLGILGANGIVGAGIPIALGSAMAHQIKKNGAIAVAFFGDGAMAEGVLHETMNMAALWKCPLLLVCENNGWSEFSPTHKQFSADLSKLAEAFNINYKKIDGNNVVEVYEYSKKATELIRNGDGPFILECVTTRIRGHFEGDSQKYRDSEEVSANLEKDPIELFKKTYKDLEIDFEKLDKDAGQIIEKAVEAARADEFPTVDLAINDVYTQQKMEANA